MFLCRRSQCAQCVSVLLEELMQSCKILVRWREEAGHYTMDVIDNLVQAKIDPILCGWLLPWGCYECMVPASHINTAILILAPALEGLDCRLNLARDNSYFFDIRMRYSLK